ncbi:MAG TPA: hypothetical protein VLG93_00020, partial [Sulfuricaulis sp.]|nr:hypothetical protein [Sulfuricaulis sp.]
MSTVAVLGLAVMGQLFAARISDIAGTRHNLSVSGTGAVRATTESEICVFCHTPHGASSFPGAPLWNRQLSNQTYTVYTSSSLDAQTIAGQLAQPAGSSKLCLSCHDGTLALGAVNVLGGQLNGSINLSGAGAGGTMPPGAGGDTGFTRNLGADLRNDHPISFTYDSALAIADGELLDPAVAAHIGVGVPGARPPVPLERTGPGGQPQLQCGSCHDPHIRDSNPNEIVKFLRLNRFQVTNPVGGLFSQSGDSVCLACHDKRGWATSAHADFTVADETYTTQAAQTREFPGLLPVWRAACLNCHDPHTVHGARRLAREGTDSLTSPKSGGNSAIEETCYQCHSSAPIVSNTNNQVRDIRSEFLLPRRMPITSTDQRAAAEVHDIRDADFTEPQTLLGKISGSNRHAECTDCH